MLKFVLQGYATSLNKTYPVVTFSEYRKSDSNISDNKYDAEVLMYDFAEANKKENVLQSIKSQKPQSVIYRIDDPALIADVRSNIEKSIPYTICVELDRHFINSNNIAELTADIVSDKDVFYTFETTIDNCVYADDFFQIFKSKKLAHKIIFYPSELFARLNASSETFFHHLMFYDALSRDKELPIALRLFYSNIAKSIGGHSSEKYSSSNQRKSLSAALSGILPNVKELSSLLFNLVLNKVKNKIYKGKKFIPANVNSTIPTISSPTKWRTVLITGWYGTETAGDKAILGEVLHFIKKCSPECRILLTTIHTPISLQTNLELDDLSSVELLNINESFSPEIIQKVDAVIMGGGPIMETSEMVNVYRIFEEANRQRKARIIFGCGLGPFHTDYIKEVSKKVLQLSTAGFFRDKESFDLATEMYPEHNFKFACDPAVAFIYRWKKEKLENKNESSSKPLIATLLRANTGEFAAGISSDELNKINTNAAKKMSEILHLTSEKLNARVELLHMNAPWVGGDDRLFNRIIENFFPKKEEVYTERNYLSLDEHIARLYDADIALAMRYHGHIFCMALGIPFLSIDYTSKKGKVYSLVNRIGYSKWSENWSDIDIERATKNLQELYSNKEEISRYLTNEVEKLVSLLYKTYYEVFDVRINF